MFYYGILVLLAAVGLYLSVSHSPPLQYYEPLTVLLTFGVIIQYTRLA